MNGQSSLWFVHSMQFFVWNGVQRRNMLPPEPWRPPLTRTHEPVKSGCPLASLGVGAFGSAGGGGPNCAAAGTARPSTTLRPIADFIASSLSSLLNAVGHRHDHVDLADFRDLRLDVTHHCAV